ncbi:MAG: diaminopimelate decarboxylase [Actinobacteria bacterium]|nr:MAG: diaminopimelate decarboxylase [Actinomycetota bacterium]
MLELFPETAVVEDGELAVGGARASALAAEFGTPLVVYCERTLLSCARAYVRAAPEAFIVYGAKAFPNAAIFRLFAAEGLGADVSTLGELAIALRAGVPGERIVVHGNNKSDEELTAAAQAEAAYVVLDALDEVERAARAGVRRILVRVTPGVEADTHPAIRTAQPGSKFGLPPEHALEAIRGAQEAGLETAGLHVHIGSQLLDTRAALTTVEWIAGFAARCRDELAWTPGTVDLGGGLGIRYVEGQDAPTIESFVGELTGHFREQWETYGLPVPSLILEPGRSLVGRAGLTLYEIGAVKPVDDDITYVAVDGGMSDNPRPQLYDATYSGILANRAGEEPSASYVVCGKHCESGDIMIRDLPLPEPRRGDLLAVPATGAYTLSMASNYNVVPRPAAVLVGDGNARLIRRRETLDDLLAHEV